MALDLVLRPPAPDDDHPDNPFFPLAEHDLRVDVPPGALDFPLDYLPAVGDALAAGDAALYDPHRAERARRFLPWHVARSYPHPHPSSPPARPPSTRPAGDLEDEARDTDAEMDGCESDVEDDADGSTTSSGLTEIRPYEFPDYFEKHDGRLFHSHGTSPYPLPVDGPEWKRLDAMHVLLRLLTGANYDGPVRQVLSAAARPKVVDLCNGTGKWVMEMAHEFPHAEFRGLDLVPIATQYPAPNVRFEIADVRARWRFADASVDVVHARCISLPAAEYPHILREAARVLRPGGLLLVADWGAYPALHPAHPGAPLPATARFARLCRAVLEDPGAVPLAIRIPSLVRATRAFGAPAELRRAIPLAPLAPHPHHHPHPPPQVPAAQPPLAEFPPQGLAFAGAVGAQLARAFAGAVVAGARRRRVGGADVDVEAAARAYVREVEGTPGVVGVWHTVWALRV